MKGEGKVKGKERGGGDKETKEDVSCDTPSFRIRQGWRMTIVVARAMMREKCTMIISGLQRLVRCT